jgi:orotate phosphoribosyltransferase
VKKVNTQRIMAKSITDIQEVSKLVKINEAIGDVQGKIMEMLTTSGALMEGHFALESGQHSSHFFRFASISGKTEYVEVIANHYINALKQREIKIDVVLAQEEAGFVVAETIADKLKKRLAIVRTDEKNRPTMSLVSDLDLLPRDKVLIVSDLATTGTGLRRMIDLVREKKATPVAAALFATRNREEISAIEKKEGIPVFVIINNLAFEKETYGQPHEDIGDTCEICKKEGPQSAIPSWEI